MPHGAPRAGTSSSNLNGAPYKPPTPWSHDGVVFWMALCGTVLDSTWLRTNPRRCSRWTRMGSPLSLSPPALSSPWSGLSSRPRQSTHGKSRPSSMTVRRSALNGQWPCCRTRPRIAPGMAHELRTPFSCRESDRLLAPDLHNVAPVCAMQSLMRSRHCQQLMPVDGFTRAAVGLTTICLGAGASVDPEVTSSSREVSFHVTSACWWLD